MTGKAALEGTSLNKIAYSSENNGIRWKSTDACQQLIQPKIMSTGLTYFWHSHLDVAELHQHLHLAQRVHDPLFLDFEAIL